MLLLSVFALQTFHQSGDDAQLRGDINGNERKFYGKSVQTLDFIHINVNMATRASLYYQE